MAVKVLAPGLTADRAWLARFRREATVAAQLQHPNLVPVYDFEADTERPYLVMAYLPGGSLAERLEAGPRPDPERLALDLLAALDHVHAAGVTHRDVKPGNVLFGDDGRACLSDFGVARPEDATAITQTGQIPGTARYMAPELWRGEPASAASDLFALGVLLSQCLGDEAPPRLTETAAWLGAERPDLRPRSAAAAREALERSAQPPTAAIAAERSATRPGGPRRWPALAAICAVSLLIGILVAGVIGGDEDPGQPLQRATGGADGAESAAPADPATPEPEPSQEPLPEPAASDPVALNDQGFALIQQGRYGDAIPILEQAVAGLEGSGDIAYAYALFNLGNALRLAGRPEEAIPILERRLEIPNQTGVVKAELKQAKKDAKAASG